MLYLFCKLSHPGSSDQRSVFLSFFGFYYFPLSPWEQLHTTTVTQDSGEGARIAIVTLIWFRILDFKFIWNKKKQRRLKVSHLLRPKLIPLWILHIKVLQPLNNRELKQPRRRQQQKAHKFAYLTMKNSIFARFARAFFIFWHFADVLVLSTT